MTPEEQRIAIAEACGFHLGKFIWQFSYWKDDIRSDAQRSRLYLSQEEAEPDQEKLLAAGFEVSGLMGWRRGVNDLPDYINDINAMREAEKTLGEDDCQRYHVELAEWWNRNATEKCTGFAGDYPWHASAKQRAEAFLRTLNLWKETPPA